MTVQQDGAARWGADRVRGLVLPASAGLVPAALLLGAPAPGEAFGVCRPGVLPRGAGCPALVLVEVLQAVLEDRCLVARAMELVAADRSR